MTEIETNRFDDEIDELKKEARTLEVERLVLGGRVDQYPSRQAKGWGMFSPLRIINVRNNKIELLRRKKLLYFCGAALAVSSLVNIFCVAYQELRLYGRKQELREQQISLAERIDAQHVSEMRLAELKGVFGLEKERGATNIQEANATLETRLTEEEALNLQLTKTTASCAPYRESISAAKTREGAYSVQIRSLEEQLSSAKQKADAATTRYAGEISALKATEDTFTRENESLRSRLQLRDVVPRVEPQKLETTRPGLSDGERNRLSDKIKEITDDINAGEKTGARSRVAGKTYHYSSPQDLSILVDLASMYEERASLYGSLGQTDAAQRDSLNAAEINNMPAVIWYK